jgi:Homing endonuclease associated repeat
MEERQAAHCARVDGRGPSPATAETVKRRFGSWNAALEAAGLPVREAHGQRRDRCANGHDLTDPANVYVDPRGERCCYPCKLARWRRAYRRARDPRARLADRRKARGLCVRCGRKAPEPGHTCCAECLAPLREGDRRRRRASPAA